MLSTRQCKFNGELYGNGIFLLYRGILRYEGSFEQKTES